MMQTWNAKMDFKKDLKADVKVKEESIDVSNRCLFSKVFTDRFVELFQQRQS
jgi:hypothetical protein